MNATALLVEKGAQLLLEQLASLQAENERLRQQLAHAGVQQEDPA